MLPHSCSRSCVSFSCDIIDICSRVRVGVCGALRSTIPHFCFGDVYLRSSIATLVKSVCEPNHIHRDRSHPAQTA